jgi:hypothetical protein
MISFNLKQTTKYEGYNNKVDCKYNSERHVVNGCGVNEPYVPVGGGIT